MSGRERPQGDRFPAERRELPGGRQGAFEAAALPALAHGNGDGDDGRQGDAGVEPQGE